MMRSNGQRNGVRQYKKSALPRLQWTPELHEHFVDTVESLGGRYKATPKRIVQMMGVKGLKISHVKSHLQMYRNMRERTTFDVFVPAESCNFRDGRLQYSSTWAPQGHTFERLLRPSFDESDEEKKLGCYFSGNNERNESNPIGHHLFYLESQGSLNCEMTTAKAEEDGGGPSDETFEQIPQSAYNNEDHRRQVSPVKDDRNSHSGAASTDTVDLRHLHSTKDSEINLDLSISCPYW
ncbi:myb family transcription factor PHL4-like [Ipomoea triloba]|uniref:myb family transcription factor PHL4-like n=1 Tax=Ipomoea triloba TaxID=35885 RepID=UPI00125D0097|nr:myb family transcription factor PHL4-like [Ipomoea triloba]